MDYNKAEITLAGKHYTLQIADSAEYIGQLASQLNKRIDTMLAENDAVSLVDAALLVALDILDESMRVNSNIDNIRTQIKTYVDEAAKARLEADRLNRELIHARREIDQLKTDMGLLTLKDGLKDTPEAQHMGQQTFGSEGQKGE